MEFLEKISTQWSRMEEISEKGGPSALAEFITARYFCAIVAKIRVKQKGSIDELRIYELASDVIYNMIKNNYRGINRIKRGMGKFRGFLSNVINNVIIDKIYRKKKQSDLPENIFQKISVDLQDIYMDFQDTLGKLQETRPLLYEPFVMHYLEGKSIKKISGLLKIEVNAVKTRLYSARQWFAEEMKDYGKL